MTTDLSNLLCTTACRRSLHWYRYSQSISRPIKIYLINYPYKMPKLPKLDLPYSAFGWIMNAAATFMNGRRYRKQPEEEHSKRYARARYRNSDIETPDDVFLEPSAFPQTDMSHTTMICVPTFVAEREGGCDNFTLLLLTLDSPCGTLPNHVYGKMVKFNALSRYGPRKWLQEREGRRMRVRRGGDNHTSLTTMPPFCCTMYITHPCQPID